MNFIGTHIRPGVAKTSRLIGMALSPVLVEPSHVDGNNNAIVYTTPITVKASLPATAPPGASIRYTTGPSRSETPDPRIENSAAYTEPFEIKDPQVYKFVMVTAAGQIGPYSVRVYKFEFGGGSAPVEPAQPDARVAELEEKLRVAEGDKVMAEASLSAAKNVIIELEATNTTLQQRIDNTVAVLWPNQAPNLPTL